MPLSTELNTKVELRPRKDTRIGLKPVDREIDIMEKKDGSIDRSNCQAIDRTAPGEATGQRDTGLVVRKRETEGQKLFYATVSWHASQYQG